MKALRFGIGAAIFALLPMGSSFAHEGHHHQMTHAWPMFGHCPDDAKVKMYPMLSEEGMRAHAKMYPMLSRDGEHTRLKMYPMLSKEGHSDLE